MVSISIRLLSVQQYFSPRCYLTWERLPGVCCSNKAHMRSIIRMSLRFLVAMSMTTTSLKHALAREVEEETGLNVSRVIAELPTSCTRQRSRCQVVMEQAQSIRKSCVQLNFVVEAEADVIHVNPDEHSVSGLPGGTSKVWRRQTACGASLRML